MLYLDIAMQLNTYLFVIGFQATMLIAEEVQKVSKNTVMDKSYLTSFIVKLDILLNNSCP